MREPVRYHARQERLVPEYVCQRDGIEHAQNVVAYAEQGAPLRNINSAVVLGLRLGLVF